MCVARFQREYRVKSLRRFIAILLSMTIDDAAWKTLPQVCDTVAFARTTP